MFKLGILFGDGVEIPEIADGYEFYEIPCGIQMDPMQSNYVWQQKKADIQAVCNLPVSLTSQWRIYPRRKTPGCLMSCGTPSLSRGCNIFMEL